MRKQLRNGKIAVIHTNKHGGGWYSWHNITELLFDPTLVEMIERDADADEIIEYCQTAYDPDGYYDSADSLTVTYVDTSDSFYIDEYDGCETVVLKSTFKWISAV